MVALEKTSSELPRLQCRSKTTSMGLIHFPKKKSFKFLQTGYYSPGRILGEKLDLAIDLLCLA